MPEGAVKRIIKDEDEEFKNETGGEVHEIIPHLNHTHVQNLENEGNGSQCVLMIYFKVCMTSLVYNECVACMLTLY